MLNKTLKHSKTNLQMFYFTCNHGLTAVTGYDNKKILMVITICRLLAVQPLIWTSRRLTSKGQGRRCVR